MVKNWVKLFDQLANIHQAADAAYDLGYWSNYIDGGTITNPNWEEEMVNHINKLCGSSNWPDLVKLSYKEGLAQGYWDT